MSTGGHIRHRSNAPSPKPTQPQLTSSKGKGKAGDTPFQPCAATASLFLYAHGPTVLCLHHDTLAVERKFQRHGEDIQFISVDNVSERGAGRLVVTYDVGRTAIVWDLFSGEQVARFASYEPIQVASWMRNGNVAFGNAKGEVILFEPSTSEHLSARTIFDPITALAPSSDCKTYAIGYNNGSILLAGLSPNFTILHTLTTSRAPSPIATLSWHASSSKQKSDMLATQTSDGDLRVWSVAKPASSDVPRVIRVLKRSDTFLPGRNWISWSKNGRIIQFSEGETWSWDVRTKNVTYEPVQTIEHVSGLSAYGPTATLFTLGPNYTVQQYDLERPQMVANVQLIPSTVATPFDENKQLGATTSGSEEDLASPIGRMNNEMKGLEAARAERRYEDSPRSNLSNPSNSTGSYASIPKSQYLDMISPANQTDISGTHFSVGTMSANLQDPSQANSPMDTPKSPFSARSARKISRLRQEIIHSPADKPTQDLFPYTRSRLNDVPHKQARLMDETRVTPDALRRQMLSVVFGWEDDIRDLIRDELSRHPSGSQNAAFLSKWLDDDPHHMATMLGTSETPASLDWMMLALSGINTGTNSNVAQIFVQKMLGKGDIHAAATTLLAMGQHLDAIEVYVTRNRYMEAILLACLLTPQDWQRQSHLVRRWGEHVVENSQQQLAIRCFSCTGVEPSDAWASPAVSQMPAQLPMQVPVQVPKKISEQRSPHPTFMIPPNPATRRDFLEAPTPIAMPAPPIPQRQVNSKGSRVTAKTSALKLITSFGPQTPGDFRFPGLKSDDRTPTNGAAITPIAESAISRSALSPGGLGSYRQNNVRSINQAMTARTGNFHRRRLPSIGETPIDVTPPSFPNTVPRRSLPTPADSESEREKYNTSVRRSLEKHGDSQPALILTSARYDPSSNLSKPSPVTALPPPTAITFDMVARPPSAPVTSDRTRSENSRSRNRSRSRKPEGLSIQMIPVDESTPNNSYVNGTSIRRPSTAGSYPVTAIETQSDLTSPPTTSNSTRSVKSPSVSGRSLDQYLSSLEQAKSHNGSHKSRPNGFHQNPSGDDLEENRSRNRHREQSDNNSEKSQRRAIPASKRSPSSPVPMSPDDLRLYSGSVESFDSIYHSQQSGHSRASTVETRQKHFGRRSGGSKNFENKRHRSRSKPNRSGSKPSSRGPSGRTSPVSALDSQYRGRSVSRKDESSPESPPSPAPTPHVGVDRIEADPALRLVSHDRERLHRSGSRRHDRSTSARRDMSPDRRKVANRSRSRQASDRGASLTRRNSVSSKPDHHRPLRQRAGNSSHTMDHEDRHETLEAYQTNGGGLDPESRSLSNPRILGDPRRKQLAAAELEARRQSLARRPSVPLIPLPGQAATHVKSASFALPISPNPQASITDRYHTDQSPMLDQSGFEGSLGNKQKAQKGHPGTPRAMARPFNTQDPAIPDIPDNIETLLTSDVYRPSVETEIRRTTSAPPEHVGLPLGLPRHPAFDHKITASRSSSKNREHLSPRPASRERNTSRDHTKISSNDSQSIMSITSHEITSTTVIMPPLLPELQHLVSPPPPPPPPPVPQQYVNMNPPASATSKLSLQTDLSPVNTANVPKTALSDPPYSAAGSGHRRGRSINETSNGNFVSKVRSIAERMRSSSRGRDNAIRSPQPENGGTPSPYESIPAFVPQQPQQVV